MSKILQGDPDAALTPDEWRRRAVEFRRRDKPREAMASAWSAFDMAPDERSTQLLLVGLLRSYPDELLAQRSADYLRLLSDGRNDPQAIAAAGWGLLVRSYRLADAAGDGAFIELAGRLEDDPLALALLSEAPVAHSQAEHLLARLRRWLLLARRSREYPALTAALAEQASLNGGAWPFDADERTQLREAENRPMLPAYLPSASNPATLPEVDPPTAPVSDAVAAQYEGWPYPAWTRITQPQPTTLPDRVRDMHSQLAAALPVAANILVAGCGTGREAAVIARRYPDASVTGIDISAQSIAYARRQCAALGISNLCFLQLDLHEVSRLDEHFHAIHCSGVLHHLSDPEGGWRALTEVLEAAGVMRIMLYSKASRLPVQAARKLLGGLGERPVDDDLLREVRGRLSQQAANPMFESLLRSPDFATLAGTHDLLLHRHEDPFDLRRIERALTTLGLSLLRFDLPSPYAGAQYEARFAHDPGHRDIPSLIEFSRQGGAALWGNFSFWCGRTPQS